MSVLLVADKDKESRETLVGLLAEAGYTVQVTDSAANAISDILKKKAQVVLLGSSFDDMTAADLIPLLKQCNRNVSIILVSDDVSLPLMRKLRREGIFYHARPPVKPEDREELKQAVACAFETHRTQQYQLH